MATVNAKSAKPAIFVIFYIIGVDVLATIDRIVALLAEQSKKQKDLTDYLGLEKGAFTKWKKGENESYMKRINEISEFFDVSVDYLLCNTDIKKEPSIEEDAELMELLKKPALKAAWDLLKQMDERQIDVAYSQLEALMRLQDKE